MADTTSISRRVLDDLGATWKRLVASDLVYKATAFVILTPLSAVLLQLFIRLSGKTVLSDQDILFFLLRPVGWLTVVVCGAIVLGIVALEMAALMLIGFGASAGREVTVRGALAAAIDNARGIVLVTARMMGLVLLTIAPFALLAGGVYLLLLTEHDINYYLTFRPPEFRLALLLAGFIVAALLLVLVRLVSGWLYALPLLLFEQVAAPEALATSAARARGHRLWITKWIVVWALVSMVLSLVITGPIVLLGRLVLPNVAGKLALLVPILGLTAGLWAVGQLVVGVATICLFALLLVHLYLQRGSSGEARMPRAALRPSEAAGWRLQLTRRRLLWALLGLVVLAAAIGGLALSRIQVEDHTEITAHRGASGAAPENTLAAVRRAIEDGADWVEIDVQETADGIVVVAHDSDFMKVANDATKIWEATYEELLELDIGSWFGPQFAGERVPTLAEVLDTCKGKVKVNIELKYYGHDVRLEERVIELVEERAMADEVVVMSLELDGVEKMQSLRPEWTVGLLAAVAVGDLTRLDVDFLAVNAKLATPLFIRSAHAKGKQVYVWTVNDPVGMSTQFSRGIDSLITDEPGLAREVLAHRAELGSVERLLVEMAALFGVGSDLQLTEADA